MSTCPSCAGSKKHPTLVGRKFERESTGIVVKVMAVVDNYVMLRVPRCVPYIIHCKQFLDEYRRV